MIVEQFKPSFDWIRANGVENLKLEAHFDYLYREYQDVFDLHLNCERAKKTESRDFSNIRFNAMMKLVVMDVLTDILKLDIETKKRLCRATVVPNWDLHFTKRPQDYPDGVPQKLAKMADGIKFDRDLVVAAGPEFFTKNLVDNASDEELLMLLVSDLVDERNMGHPTIMDVDTHLDFKQVERKDLGQAYWDRERKKDHEVMRKLFPMIAPELFPTIILRHMVDKLI